MLLVTASPAAVSGQSGIPVFKLLVAQGGTMLCISHTKAVQSTQHAFPYALGSK